MDITCRNCREILLGFDRQVAVNSTCGHYLCQQCVEAIQAKKQKSRIRCPCGDILADIQRLSINEFIDSIKHDLKQIADIGAKNRYYHRRANDRSAKHISVGENALLKRRFDEACKAAFKCLSDYTKYLKQRKVSSDTYYLPPDLRKTQIIRRIGTSFDGILDALAAFVVQNGYTVTSETAKFFPNIVNLENELEERFVQKFLSC